MVISSHGVICLDKQIYHDLLIKASDWSHHATSSHDHIMSPPGLCFTFRCIYTALYSSIPPQLQSLGIPTTSLVTVSFDILYSSLLLYPPFSFSLSCWCGLVPSSVALTEAHPHSTLSHSQTNPDEETLGSVRATLLGTRPHQQERVKIRE